MVVVVAILFICWQMPADAVFCRLFDFFWFSSYSCYRYMKGLVKAPIESRLVNVV